MNLVEKVNKNLPEGMGVELIPSFYRGRSCLKIKDNNAIRKNVFDLVQIHTCIEEIKYNRGIDEETVIQLYLNAEYADKVKELLNFGIKTISLPFEFKYYFKEKEELPFAYVCRDWVFDQLEMPELTRREDRIDANILLRKNLPDIIWTPEPQVDDIVAYFIPNYKMRTDPYPENNLSETVSHWGLVSNVNGTIQVRSKWDKHAVYEHPLALVPKVEETLLTDAGYGDFVYFFRKIK